MLVSTLKIENLDVKQYVCQWGHILSREKKTHDNIGEKLAPHPTTETPFNMHISDSDTVYLTQTSLIQPLLMLMYTVAISTSITN